MSSISSSDSTGNNNPLIDWLAEPAGARLDRYIAELQGWRDDSYEASVGGNTITVYHAYAKYSTDVNAALTLVPAGTAFEMRNYDENYDLTVWEAIFSQMHLADADTPALAICRAWLVWRDDGENEWMPELI